MAGTGVAGGEAAASLNVLHLLAHLVDHRLEFETDARDLGIGGLGAERICFAVELLGQKVEAAPGGLFRFQECARGGDVGAETLEFFLDIGAGREQCRFW